MAAIAYWVTQWKLAYLPTLKRELARDGQRQKMVRLLSAFCGLVLGLLGLIWLQVSLGDAIGASIMPGASLLDGHTRVKIAEKAGFENLNADSIRIQGFAYSSSLAPVLFSGIAACTLLTCSMSSLIHTRRYRYTWKYYWAPTLSTVFWCCGTLIAVHAVYLFLMTHTSSSTAPIEFTAEKDAKSVQDDVMNWCENHGYNRTSYENAVVVDGSSPAGEMNSQVISPKSWFDRYLTSFRYYIVRPSPTMRVTIVQHGSAKSYIVVELPSHGSSPQESALWQSLVSNILAHKLGWQPSDKI